MKFSVVLAALIFCGQVAMAKSPAECLNQAKNLAVHEISDEQDLPPGRCIALEKSGVQNGGALMYVMDVVCGDASVAQNHHSDQVLLFASNCNNASIDEH